MKSMPEELLHYSIFDNPMYDFLSTSEKEYLNNYKKSKRVKNRLMQFKGEGSDNLTVLYLFRLDNFNYLDFFKILYLIKLQREGIENIKIVMDKEYLRSKGIEEYTITEYTKILDRSFRLLGAPTQSISIIDQDNFYSKLLKDQKYNKLLRSINLSGLNKYQIDLHDFISILKLNYIASTNDFDMLLTDFNKFDLCIYCQDILKNSAKINSPDILTLIELPLLYLKTNDEIVIPNIFDINSIESIIKNTICNRDASAKIYNYFIKLFIQLVYEVPDELNELLKNYSSLISKKGTDSEYKLKVDIIGKSIILIFEYFTDKLGIANKPEIIEIIGTSDIFDALRNKIRFDLFKIILNADNEIEYSDLLIDIKKLNKNIDPSTISKAVKRLESLNLIGVRDVQGSRKKYLRALAKKYNIQIS